MKAGNSFDKRLVKDFSFDFEFDEQKLTRFLAKANLSLDYIREQVLYELDCGKPIDHAFFINNAGILFFAKEPQKRIDNAFISCFRYKGNSMQAMLSQDCEGDLTSQINEAEAFVKLHTRTAFKFDGFKRINIEEYPFTAIREAIVNAVCHRDYSIKNNIIVNVFDDRVEIISPGGIPNNLTLKEVRGKSYPRNWIISKLFRKIKEIEKVGTGLNRMDELMLAHGLKKPEYEANQSFFVVSFYGPKEKIFDLVKPSNEMDLRELGLNDRQIKVLSYLQEKRVLTAKNYKILFKVTRKTAVRDLNKLLELKLLMRKGKTHNTQYFLNASNTEEMSQN